MSRNLKSPVTGLPLKEINIDGLVVDVGWKGCGGIWFDKGELEQVDEAHETKGEALLNIPRDPNILIPERANRKCPVDGTTMKRIRFGDQIPLEIDECPECGGIWLDGGELEKLRNFFQDEAHRKAAQEIIEKEFVQNREFDAFLNRRGRRGKRTFAKILGVSLPPGVVIKM